MSLDEIDFSDFDVDMEVARVTGQRSERRGGFEHGSYEWQCEQGALFHAWVLWGARIKEFRLRHRNREAPKGWFSRQQRRAADKLCAEFGYWMPAPEYMQWRLRRLRELGREEEAKAMEGRMPWE